MRGVVSRSYNNMCFGSFNNKVKVTRSTAPHTRRRFKYLLRVMISSQEGIFISEDAIHFSNSSEDPNGNLKSDKMSFIKVFRNQLTDNSSESSQNVSNQRDCLTCSSQDTVSLYSGQEDVGDDLSGIRSTGTLSNDMQDEDNFAFRRAETMSSLEKTESNTNSMSFRSKSTYDSFSSDGPNEERHDNSNSKLQKHATENEMDFRESAPSHFADDEKENEEDDKINNKCYKRRLIDAGWEGLSTKEPKLVKYASIGPFQDFPKDFLRRTSSEGVSITEESK